MIEELIGSFRFVEHKDIEEAGRPRTLLLGLPDTGLVSLISSRHIIDALGLEEVGEVVSPAIDHISVVYEGVPKSPVRIYAGNNLAIVYMDIPLSPELQIALAASTVDYARLRGFDKILALTGLPAPNRLDLEELRTYYVSPSRKMAELAEAQGVQRLRQGILIGGFATMLKETARKKVESLVLLTESYIDFPDPEAAARGLQYLSKIVNLSLDVSKLLEEAELIKLRTRELMRQTRGIMSQMKKEMEASPIIYG